MEEKEYYSSKEFRKKIKGSIIKNWEELKKDIKAEKEYIINKDNIYA
jgi:hypothetical protein